MTALGSADIGGQNRTVIVAAGKEYDERELQETAAVARLVKIEKCFDSNQKKIILGLELKPGIQKAIRESFNQLGVNHTVGAAPAGWLELWLGGFLESQMPEKART